MLGLPPTAEERDRFFDSNGEIEWVSFVDHLLDRPEYGQRWARHWLDVARYADTKGYIGVGKREERYAYGWTYRDYVVRALNEDVPFDDFIRHQIAADLLGLEEEEQWKLLPSHKRFAVPSGFKVAEPPPPAQLEFGSPERSELIERSILFKWPMDGWHVGKITSINMDADRKMEGVGNVNFFVHYEVDDDEVPTVLQLAEYDGEDAIEGCWVLLEPVAEA